MTALDPITVMHPRQVKIHNLSGTTSLRLCLTKCITNLLKSSPEEGYQL